MALGGAADVVAPDANGAALALLGYGSGRVQNVLRDVLKNHHAVQNRSSLDVIRIDHEQRIVGESHAAHGAQLGSRGVPRILRCKGSLANGDSGALPGYKIRGEGHHRRQQKNTEMLHDTELCGY